jgi:flavin reductase (DIM6/NTAB) family NADH-FMN oxidoreductase RutF
LKKIPLKNTDGTPEKTNGFCPQTPFLYGTYKEDGRPNFGLFNWFSYCWDGELHVMCCIGGAKLTKDRIHATGVFSANLVTEQMLPLADWFGSNPGYETDKRIDGLSIERGAALNVPTLADSPYTYELEVKQNIPLDEGEIFICRIANILIDERLTDETASVDERFKLVSPVLLTGTERYYGVTPNALGKWNQWKNTKPAL